LPVHDSAIVAGISAEFASDPYLRERLITVLAMNGGVVLRGAVSNTAARNQASMLAHSVDGVVDVTNDLSVQPLHD
jgi:osmotically-inducible protein OsmY